jgi:quercetin dioxygenase-like cupin family protein
MLEIMKRIGLGVLAVLVVTSQTGWSQQPASSHVMAAPAGLKWGEAPPTLPKGAQLAVLSGDPGQTGPFVIRLRMPAGYRIAAHWHPTDEHVTVVSGTFSMGMGEKFDAAATTDLAAGSYALMPAQGRHFAWTKQGATVQVHGLGPFAITYVNAADDPRATPAR